MKIFKEGRIHEEKSLYHTYRRDHWDGQDQARLCPQRGYIKRALEEINELKAGDADYHLIDYDPY